MVSASTVAEVDSAVHELVSAAGTVSLEQRVALCQQCVTLAVAAADDWADLTLRAKHQPNTSGARAEELLSGPAVLLRQLQLTSQTLRSIQLSGEPTLPSRPYRLESGQICVPVLPTSGLYDSIAFSGIQSVVRLQPDARESNLYGTLPELAADASIRGLMAVLGAGNVSSIPATDSLYAIMFCGKRVLLKLNPVNDYLFPVFERIFAPLIRANLLRILKGGVEVGEALINHPAVDSVHITGSAATHDAIVWGKTPEERAQRKRDHDPLLSKTITSELGNVTPWIIVPAEYSTRELESQAQHVAVSITNNASFNCLATKVIVTWKNWPQRSLFLQRVQHHLSRTPTRYAYYPGAAQRHARFSGQPSSIDDRGHLPWVLLIDQSIDERPELFEEESFVCVSAETALSADSPEQFLAVATEFVNERMPGTLCASVTVTPKFRKQHAREFEQCLAGLRYGTVCVNQWSGIAYGMISPPWGAYPGSNLLDVKSGIGSVHNSYLLDRFEKSVLEGPLVNFPPPVWFPDHKNAAGVANALIHLYEHPSVLRLPRLGWAAVRGLSLLLAVLLTWGYAVQAAEKAPEKPVEYQATTHSIAATKKAQFELQAALINAVPGDVIELAAGKYDFTSELNVVCDNVTLRGAGRDKTVINFKKQSAGSSGLLATGNAFVIEGLTIQDTVGSGIKVLGAQDVIFRDVKVEWTEGEKSTNGAYGIYPVECKNVLIENCVSIGASDAGIYVGQSQDVIVRGCLATRNVTGIEIENTLRADVYDNVATDNTGGIMVFDLPGLNLVNGGYVRVYKNNVKDNNHANFAPLGTVVADVPPGTGVMILAMDNVEVFDNDITGHLTNNIMILSYLIVERKDLDKKFDPYPEIISIHDNRISGGGMKPSGKISMALLPIAGGKFPDIFYDGIMNPSPSPEVQKLGKYSIRIRDNGDATFANMDVANLSPENLVTGKFKIDRDLKNYNAEIPALPAITLQPHGKASSQGNPAVAVYRAAPEQLSKWGFYEKKDGRLAPAADFLWYELNTPLFSDYTIKHRYIRLPKGAKIEWNETDSLEFPVGTVIVKTFAYPDETEDLTPGEKYIETRVEFREASGWFGYSYVWNAEQTDATLNLGGGELDVAWKAADGTQHSHKYQIPNANQCLSCHSSNGKYVPIGTTARNLNRAGMGLDAENQLTNWVNRGVLKDCPTPEKRPHLANYLDPRTGSLDARARAWLEVNCAHCHNPTGSARTSGLDLRSVQTDPGRYGVFKSPVAAGKGSGGRSYDIVPGKPDESILMFRLETQEPGSKMPSLARNLVHDESNELLREWILAMPADHKSVKE